VLAAVVARFLFGKACDLREIQLPHLSKLGERQSVGLDLFAFDLVLFLRHDNVLNPRWADLRCRDFIFPIDTHEDHQAMLDYAVVSQVIGDYDIDAYHYVSDFNVVRQKALRAPKSIAFRSVVADQTGCLLYPSV
jgi:hypothetical protein